MLRLITYKGKSNFSQITAAQLVKNSPLLLNPKFQRPVHNSLPLATLNQTKAFHHTSSRFILMSHSNISLVENHVIS